MPELYRARPNTDKPRAWLRHTLYKDTNVGKQTPSPALARGRGGGGGS